MWFAGVSSPGEGNQLEVLPTRLSLSLRGAQPKTPDIHPPPFKPRGNYKKCMKFHKFLYLEKEGLKNHI